MSNNFKMSIYTFICSLIMGIFSLFFIKNLQAVPISLRYIIAAILLIVSLIIAILEVSQNTGLFYSYGKFWNGMGIVNSGFIIGIIVPFVAGNILQVFVISFILASLNFLVWKVFSFIFKG